MRFGPFFLDTNAQIREWGSMMDTYSALPWDICSGDVRPALLSPSSEAALTDTLASSCPAGILARPYAFRQDINGSLYMHFHAEFETLEDWLQDDERDKDERKRLHDQVSTTGSTRPSEAKSSLQLCGSGLCPLLTLFVAVLQVFQLAVKALTCGFTFSDLRAKDILLVKNGRLGSSTMMLGPLRHLCLAAGDVPAQDIEADIRGELAQPSPARQGHAACRVGLLHCTRTVPVSPTLHPACRRVAMQCQITAAGMRPCPVSRSAPMTGASASSAPGGTQNSTSWPALASWPT
jgi:hypothetical protein